VRALRKKSLNSELSTNVSNLKAHLSAYLNKVKSGEEVIVYDRQMAIAKLVSYSLAQSPLIETLPTKKWNEIEAILIENEKGKKKVKKSKLSIHYLSEDRGDR
jgi:antitoxin (DNA-binding transcriptional repressor) of toxin-antitoxin stability system